MESLEETTWDVVLSGTGLLQSLLALALSRSGKKVLHVDKNEYYGGTEAALSLQEIDLWIEKVNDATRTTLLRNATLHKSEPATDTASGLAFSRAYSISLSPQLIYTRSNLLPALVSSRVHAQLEFLAVGSWWIFSRSDSICKTEDVSSSTRSPGELRRIPGGREDVFSDKSIDLRSSRSLMKFLKQAADAENHPLILAAWGSKPFPEYLTSEFKIPESLQAPLLALTSSPNTPHQTLTSFALPRIHSHLTSIGLFGPGFGAVLPKWGGLSEIAQVGCRAGAVGGGVYVLNKGVVHIQPADDDEDVLESSNVDDTHKTHLKLLQLQGGEQVNTHFAVGSIEDLDLELPFPIEQEMKQLFQSVAIISSPLSPLFYLAAEGAPPPAATVVVFPTGTLGLENLLPSEEVPPVYLTVHSSDTGECPAGQSIIYGHTSISQPHGSALLTLATQTLLTSLPPSSDPKPAVLWNLHYTRYYHEAKHIIHSPGSRTIILPSVPPGLVLDDAVLRTVRDVWATVNGGDDGSFLLFEERAGVGEAEDEDGEDHGLGDGRSVADGQADGLGGGEESQEVIPDEQG